MSNRNVLQSPKHTLRTNKNWFDMSHHIIFSDSIGLLSPVMAMETIPGENYKINLESFCRSQAVNTSSFMRIKENYDFFFVPFRLLYSYSDQFFSQVANYYSSTLATNVSDRVPLRLPMIDSDAFGDGGAIYARCADNDEFNIRMQYGMDRVFNQLDYGIWQDAQTPGQPPQHFLNDRYFRNPFRAAAYQKIYHDFYQNMDYENVSTDTFNLDWAGDVSIAANDTRIKDLFRLRYRDMRKDYLTIVKPSFNASPNMPYLGSYNDNIFFGNTISTSAANNNIPGRIQSMYGSTKVFTQNISSGASTSNTEFPYGHDARTFGGVESYPPSAGLTAQNIRALLAFDKLAQNVGLGGRDYKSQIESRFGVDLPSLRANRASLLGSFDGSVIISEVVATNGDDLGQIGGKGTSSTGGRIINFSCQEHGIIMCIHSFVPYTDYYSEMLDRNNIKCYFLDYYQPELDNLGSQPLYGFELSTLESAIIQNGIHGFVPRYIENKTRLNKVYGSQFSNHYWTAITRPNSAATKGYAALKINPKNFNTQFGIAFDGRTSTDQFICRAQFTIHKLSPMSVYGLPNYQ